MTEMISVRADEPTRRALAVLTADGVTVSDALRAAILQAAEHRLRAQLREEVAALAADHDDRAEAARVLEDMETLRAR